jgi:hypothetical protein
MYDIIFYSYDGFIAASHGGHARALSMLRLLSTKFRRIAVYSYDVGNDLTSEICDWTADARAQFKHEFPHADLIVESKTTLLGILVSMKYKLAACFPSSVHRILSWRVSALTPRFVELCQRAPRAPIVVNHVDGLFQLNGINSRRCFVETHDLGFLKLARQNNTPVTDLRVMQKMRCELGALNHAAGLVAISPSEASFLRLVLNTRVFYIPAPDVRIPIVSLNENRPLLYDLMFVGSKNEFNARGLISFMKEHESWLANKSVAVCGRICDVAEVRAASAGHSNIHLLGYVEGIDEIYNASRACLAPVDGTGLKIKVLDALARGKPTFVAPPVLEGLPEGYEDCVFVASPETIDAIITDERRINRARVASRDYVERFMTKSDRAAFIEALAVAGTEQT